ncbi:MAG: response regulator transcription factor [Anaerolineae bacterium]|nr:response regulator transcription factor [Anaerolineae bacterium]
MSPTRILLADDHAMFRAGVRVLLEKRADLQVVAEASDGHEALRLIETHQPHLVLMDIGMPGLNGLEAAARIAKAFPQVRVIILSMHLNEEYVMQALRAGAAGYLLKDAGPNELDIAITAVLRGETYLSPAVSKTVVDDYLRRVGGQTGSAEPAASTGETRPFEALTPRQREILQLIAEGHTTKEIAQILQVSVKTAEMHRTQLMDRLNIHDIAGLVRYAIRVGLVSPDK